MPNNFGLSGGGPQKQVRFAPIYTARFYSGIFTNRSPLRDATTNRITEKFYGPAGDALIAGTNVEVTNKLTLARRPGMSEYDANSYSGVNRFYEFRIFNPNDEQIYVMVDETDTLYSTYGGAKNLVFNKNVAAGAGQSYMQSVGNILYWGDGVDNKKWLQSLNIWISNTQWGTAGSPFFTTFIIDPNGNIQQLTGSVVPITNISVTSDVVTVTSSISLTNLLSIGIIFTMPATLTASFLENQVLTVTGVSGSTFTANFSNANYTGTESTNIVFVNSGTPTSGPTVPVWSTVIPEASNKFAGGVTVDGTVQWTNRGPTVENWGIQPPTIPITPTLGAQAAATWAANTFYSIASVIIDTNGNLQQVTTAGKSNGTAPTWNATLYGTTSDGTAVWTTIQTAAQLNWQSGFAYVSPLVITEVASPVSGSAVYTGLITGGAANGLSGKSFLITGFSTSANNGIFACTASTTTTLTLSNASAVAQNASTIATAVQRQTVQYVIGNAAGTNSLFKLTPSSQPVLTGSVSAYLYAAPHSGPVGQFLLTNPTSTGSALASDTSLNSLEFTGAPLSSGATLNWTTINGAGQSVGTVTPFPSYTENYQLVILATLSVPVAGQYTFVITHHDGTIWGMGGGATVVSGPNNNPIGQTLTAVNGYPVFGGTNIGLEGGAVSTDTFVINFPTAGLYPIEMGYDYWYHSGQQLNVQCNGQPLANGTTISGSTQPSWPGFSTSYAPAYATAVEAAGNLVWSNIGPVSDFSWTALENYTLPNTLIFDSNGYTEAPFRSGFTAAKAPVWATGINNLTADNPNLIWINEGGAANLPSGTLSAFNGGWRYCVAIVNTLDDTVSNCTPLSAPTGNFVGISGVKLAPGSGLPPLGSIDPQADYVAIFRTTDGQAIPFLIPGVSTTYTLPLSTYITSGYTDTTPDTGLNNLLEGAILGENTPPAPGAQNLSYHLNRIFYSVGNVLYWTTGPSDPVGNGLNGAAPFNTDSLPSLIKRIVPITTGALVFTVSDVYIIQGNGTANSPILSGVPIFPGVGLLNYNALDLNGPTIGWFTTDNNFVILDPSAGLSYVGLPIGDQLLLNNGSPGQSWDPQKVYVAWHVQGEDQAWYVGDGKFGWYRMMQTPFPETGFTWSPFAQITGGIAAMQSVEITPGVHRLMTGPTGTGSVLMRNLQSWTDNGTSYPANAVLGSCVLSQPGQVATVSCIVTDSVRIGSPMNLGILVDEALPYYNGPIDIIKQRTNDPPRLRASRSLYSERFYLSTLPDETAVMRHCQVQIIWSPTDTVQNEILTLTIFGAYQQEL